MATRTGMRRHRRGSAAMEFGMWFVPMVMILSGIIDLSWYMSLRENIMRAGRDAARTAAATDDDPDTEANETIIAAESVGQEALDEVGFNCPDAIEAALVSAGIGGVTIDTVEVDVTCEFKPLIGLLPTVVGVAELNQLQAHFVMVLEP